MSNRREAREHVMQALYAQELSKSTAEDVIETVLQDALTDATSMAFAKKLLLRTLSRRDELDQIIGQHAENWDLGRIATVDRVVLRMAVCELLTFEDIPPKVTIDEAIEVAKRYSTDKSGPFINGVLDAVLLDLQRQGRLQKSGRGLVGMDSIRDRATPS